MTTRRIITAILFTIVFIVGCDDGNNRPSSTSSTSPRPLLVPPGIPAWPDEQSQSTDRQSRRLVDTRPDPGLKWRCESNHYLRLGSTKLVERLLIEGWLPPKTRTQTGTVVVRVLDYAPSFITSDDGYYRMRDASRAEDPVTGQLNYPRNGALVLGYPYISDNRNDFIDHRVTCQILGYAYSFAGMEDTNEPFPLVVTNPEKWPGGKPPTIDCPLPGERLGEDDTSLATS